MKIPDKGLDKDTVFEKLERFRDDDANWREGKTFGYVFDAGEEVNEVGKKAFTMYLSENGLDPTVYTSLLKLENEVVDMARAHLNGDENVVGSFTSGGTESCMLALKAARDYAREKKPGIKEPEMVLPATAHAAFHKGAHYFSVKPVVAPVDPKTFKADVDELRKAVTSNTIFMVGSAPSYAHGVVDPITEMGRLALEKDIFLHVDGCIGGFLLPYFKRLGAEVADFDFRVPGVTSMSMDWHKYAYCPKGSSVVLYKNKELRQYQLFACSGWTGYTVINNTIQSSKSGGPLAATWAVLNYLGEDGYLKIAKGIMEATKKFTEGIKQVEDLYIMGEPEMSLIAVTSDTVNIFHLIDEMKTRGWYIQPQLALDDYKHNFHISINPSNVQWMEALLKDLDECCKVVKPLGLGGLPQDAIDNLSAIKPEEMDATMLNNLLSMAGMDGFDLPEKMAPINELLNILPPKLADKVLIIFFNELYQSKGETAKA